MRAEIVDCIILAMLKEERELFLKANNCLIYDKTKIHDDFLDFIFFDKNNKLRSGVFCSSDREMGNNEASKLFYKISRKYQSELCINIGVVGYINEVCIGDVIIVDDNYSLSEKNVANDKLQKTDAKLDKDFIRNTVCNPLERSYAEIFKASTEAKLNKLRMNLNKYIEHNTIDEKLKKSLAHTCEHKANHIKLGACATYHSVVKDKKTRAAIKDVRKTNIVDMEAYYFNDWHKLIRTEEYDESLKDSKIIFIKSISDTAIDEEKAILEKIQSRYLAMSNIYDVVSYFISNLFEFSQRSDICLLDYFNKEISDKHIDKLIKYTVEAYDALEKLCPYIIINKKIGDVSIEGNYIQASCNVLEKENQILVLEGNPGKGKSTFISYVYKKIAEKHSAVFISIPELINSKGLISSEQSLFLLEHLLKNDNNITVFVDGVEGSRHTNSEDNKKILECLITILNKYGKCNISLCIGAWNTNDETDIKRDILNKFNADNEVSTLTFKSVSSLDNTINEFVVKFAEFYKFSNNRFDVETFVSNVKNIVNNTDLQLSYVDFRLLHIFARNNRALKESKNIFEFISVYCGSKITDKNYNIMNDVTNLFDKVNPIDRYGLLTKNIYSRAFAIAEFIYSSFVDNIYDNICKIINNKFILSDNINLFLAYMLNSNADRAKRFENNVLKILKKRPNCQICSKIQLLYNISSIKCLSGQRQKNIMNYILHEIKKIDEYDLLEQESDIIIGYRTLAIILNNKFDIGDYLEKFNSILMDTNRPEESDIVKKINRNFHLLYYSQMEFTYDKVEDDVLFESEVVWNTFHILKNSVTYNKYNIPFIKTCAITLMQLVDYIKQGNSTLTDVFSEQYIADCMKTINNKLKQYNIMIE